MAALRIIFKKRLGLGFIRKSMIIAKKNGVVGIKIAKRHATSPMPYRPGYGLGSIIEPEVIQGMTEEAQVRSEIVILEQLENDFESTAKGLKNEKERLALAAQLNNESFDPAPYDEKIKMIMDQRKPITDRRVNAYTKLFEVMSKLIDSGRPTTFNSGVASPIVWPECEIKYMDRAYDSISVDASLHVRQGSKQSMSDFAGGVAAEVSGKSSGVFRPTIEATVKSQIQGNSSRSSDEDESETILVLTAFATHRKVQQFAEPVMDANRLIKAWNHYFPEEKINPLDIGKDESEFEKNDLNKQISILAECFLGSAMIGMVHHVKKKETTTSQSAVSTQSQMAASVKFGSWLSSVTGSTQVSTNAASRFANMMYTEQADVKFDLTCLGYLPKLHHSNIEMAVEKFANFDPGAFTKQSAKVIGDRLEAVDTSKGLKDNKEAARQQSNMGSVIESTVMSISKADQANKTAVLDLDTFMNAFDDYAENAPTTDGVGIPVGMNVLSYGRGDICFKYAQQFLGVSEDRSASNPNAPQNQAGAAEGGA